MPETPIGDPVLDERAQLLEEVARAALGHDDLRPGQLEAASAAVAGDDVLAVMPTGSGKSAIYQLTGALAPGPVVVISPLLALQRDQIAALDGRMGGARALNSTLSATDHAALLVEVAAGEVKFLMMAPEQLANADTLARLAEIDIALLVVDEAHCIASWGRDFRPEYLMLGERRAALGDPPVLALTATASPPVRREIVAELRMQDPVVVTAGIVRPNIRLEVTDTSDRGDADTAVIRRTSQLEGGGIVYVPTRAKAEEIAEALSSPTRDAVAYHAGLPADEREAVEQRFVADDNLVVVATIAFGMGIDVPHVRFVVHDQAPDSLDSYYQELGRAGRDGEPATAVLVRTVADASARAFQSGSTVVDHAAFDRLARGVAAFGEAVDSEVVREDLGLARTHLTIVVEHLSRLDALEVSSEGELRWTSAMTPEEAAEQSHALHQREQQLSKTAREMLREYLDTSGCRWRFLATYFGAGQVEDCANCDRCDARTDAPEGVASEDEVDHGFVIGDTLQHTKFGCGTIEGVDGDRVTVLFDDAGYRTLSAVVLTDNDLTEQPAPEPA